MTEKHTHPETGPVAQFERRCSGLARSAAIMAWLYWPVHSATADGITFGFEMSSDPCLPGGGWICGNPCDADCFDYIEDGHYVAEFLEGNGLGQFNYHRTIALPTQLPPSLFIEARFRSNSTYDGIFYTNDARISANYDAIGDPIYMHGDSVHSASADFEVLGLSPAEFHSYRFESVDAHNWTWAVDGLVFVDLYLPTDPEGGAYVQFSSDGATLTPGLKNEWDWIRYGTISFGELVVAADPPAGYIDPRQDRPTSSNTLQGLTRFTVTFDEPNGLHIGNVTVESTAPAALRPGVQWITRPEGDDGDTWEIRLDKRIPPGHRTRFIISDEAEAAAVGQQGATTVVELSFLPGDVNGNGTSNTQDLLAWISAVNQGTANLLHHDINRNELINTQDLLRMIQLLNGTLTQQPWNGVSLPNWP